MGKKIKKILIYLLLPAFLNLNSGILLDLKINAASMLNAPKNVRIYYPRTRSAKLKWTNVYYENSAKRPDYYKIIVECDGKEEYSKRHKKNLKQKKNSAYLHDLLANSQCVAKIKTVRDDKESNWVEKKFETIKQKSGWKDLKLYDTLAHVDTKKGKLNTLKSYLKKRHIKRTILMSTPMPLLEYNKGQWADNIYHFTSNNRTKLKTVFGGEHLNPLLNALYGQELTEDNLFPNGVKENKDLTDEFAITQAYDDNPDLAISTLQELATAAAASGQYIGFGELSPFHDSKHKGYPHIRYAADNEQMLWLSDLAATYNMFIVIHAEPTQAIINELSNLCAHNRQTKILWDHVGWIEKGEANVNTYSSMLENNENLYILIKQRNSNDFGDYFPLKKNGVLKTKWKKFFNQYKERIMAETDSKYWIHDENSIKNEYYDNVEPLLELLDQLPESTAQQIAYKTARNVLGL